MASKRRYRESGCIERPWSCSKGKRPKFCQLWELKEQVKYLEKAPGWKIGQTLARCAQGQNDQSCGLASTKHAGGDLPWLADVHSDMQHVRFSV